MRICDAVAPCTCSFRFAGLGNSLFVRVRRCLSPLTHSLQRLCNASSLSFRRGLRKYRICVFTATRAYRIVVSAHAAERRRWALAGWAGLGLAGLDSETVMVYCTVQCSTRYGRGHVHVPYLTPREPAFSGAAAACRTLLLRYSSATARSWEVRKDLRYCKAGFELGTWDLGLGGERTPSLSLVPSLGGILPSPVWLRLF